MADTSFRSRAAFANWPVLPLVIAAIFFGVLWRFDFPRPFVDDLFYCGAGLNLASGGDLSNPLLLRQGFPSHYFFVYPPLHSYAVGAWLRIFGISAAALTGFQMTMCVIIAGATIVVLRRRGAPTLAQCLVPLAVSTAMLPGGLRPEPFATALIMSGYALAESGSKTVRFQFPGALGIFLGASAAPRLVPFAGALLCLLGYELWQGPSGRLELRRFCVCALCGLLTTFLVFLVLIGFRLPEFWHTIRQHADRVHWATRESLALHFIGFAQWPALLMSVALLLLSLRRPADRLIRIGFFAAGGSVVATLLGGFGAGTIFDLLLALLALMAAELRRGVSRFKSAVLGVLLAGSLVLANSKSLVDIIGVLSGRIQTDIDDQTRTAGAMKPTLQHPLLVDVSTARYVFGYKLPAGTLDWGYAAPFPLMVASDTNLLPGDIFVLGPPSVDGLRKKGYLDLQPPEWTFWGMRRWSYHVHPRAAYIIPAEACKEPRAQPSSIPRGAPGLDFNGPS